MKPILICALHTGMRKGEILSLKWECVDLEERYITLLKTKSGKKRIIPISNRLFEELDILNQNKLSEYVFVNPETKNPYYDLKRAFNLLCKEANVKNFVFHDIRHTAATRMVAAGIDLAVVREVLGHSDISTTMRYAHPVPEQKKKAIEALNNYTSGKNINLIQLK
jgi:integrase